MGWAALSSDRAWSGADTAALPAAIDVSLAAVFYSVDALRWNADVPCRRLAEIGPVVTSADETGKTFRVAVAVTHAGRATASRRAEFASPDGLGVGFAGGCDTDIR